MRISHIFWQGLVVWVCFGGLIFGKDFAGAQEPARVWKKVLADTGQGWKSSSFLVSDDGRRLALQEKGKVLWQQDAAEEDTGNICGRPVIARSNDPDHPWIVAAGNGCNSKTGKARVVVSDLADGAVLASFVFEEKEKNGICSVTLVDSNGDDRADVGYAGDLRGNIWKFFLAGSHVQWQSASSVLLFTASCAGHRQPITAAPNVFRHCSRPGVLVSFGTGRFLDEHDWQDNRQQSLYVVWDRGGKNWRLGRFDAAKGQLFPPAEAPFSLSAAPSDSPVTLLEHRLENVNEAYRTGTDFLPVWWKEKEKHPKANHLGWYVNLPGIGGRFGERITNKVLVRAGTLFAFSFVPATGSSPGTSAVFALRACVGGVFSRPVFDANADGIIDKKDCVKEKSMAARMIPGTFENMTLGEKNGKPVLLLSGQTGEKTVLVRAPKEGIFFWQQVEGN